MKKQLLFLAANAIFIAGHGQTATETKTSGIVRYEEKMKLEIKLEGESAAFADQLPKERTEQKILWFTPEMSLYRGDPEKQNKEVEEHEAAGAIVQVKMASSDDQVYYNFRTGIKTEQRDFMTRMFLIESDIEKPNWKLTGEQKTILNYHCQEAQLDDNGKKVKAWFTPEIPVPAGPQKFGNLPGLILAVDIDDGSRTLTATSVEPKPVDQSLLVKPKKGKKVTAEQYKKIVDEKMKEMGGKGGDGVHMIIRVQK